MRGVASSLVSQREFKLKRGRGSEGIWWYRERGRARGGYYCCMWGVDGADGPAGEGRERRMTLQSTTSGGEVRWCISLSTCSSTKCMRAASTPPINQIYYLLLSLLFMPSSLSLLTSTSSIVSKVSTSLPNLHGPVRKRTMYAISTLPSLVLVANISIMQQYEH